MKRRNSYGIYASQPVPGGTPQTQRARDDQVRNYAGGYAFKASPWDRLDRFLILGSESNTYYVGAQQLTKENAKNIVDLLDSSEDNGLKVVQRIVQVSQEGRAAKQSPAIFALALAVSSKHDKVRSAAGAAVNKVCRIPTFLFEFVEYAQALRGWGSVLQNSVKRYYENTPLDTLAYHVIKYRQRNGWTQRDLLRLGHPKTDDTERDNLFKFITQGYSSKHPLDPEGFFVVNSQVYAWEDVNNPEWVKANGVRGVANLIREHKLTREMVPTELLKSVEVWEALLEDMPLNATMRSLATMTANGTLVQGGRATRCVLEKLGNTEAIRRARIHPFNALVAYKTYGQGYGFRGQMTWNPIPVIKNALEDVYNVSFGNVEPSGLRTMIAIDISGSMGSSFQGSPMTMHEAAACMSLVTLKSEGDAMCRTVAFDTQLKNVPWTSRDTLESALRKRPSWGWGGTDASQPILHAIERFKETGGREVYDAFLMYSDMQTWGGEVQVFEALNRYRSLTGNPNVKIAYVNFVPHGTSLGEPDDPNALDVVGFDSAAPQVISDFLKH